MVDSKGSSLPPSQPAEESSNSSTYSIPSTSDSSTDSAPPLSSNPPLPPPKSYSTFPDPYIPPTPSTSQLVRPNSAIPTFIRFLALAVFLGGSVATLTAWIYRTVFYPRLVIALNAQTALHQSHLTFYSTFLHNIRSLAKGKGYSLIAPTIVLRSPDQQALEKMEESPVVNPVVVVSPSEPTKGAGEIEGVTKGSEELVLPPEEPAPQIFAPLVDSLRTLSTSVPHPPTIPSSSFDSLSNKLSALTDYITTESFVSYSNSYRINLPSSSSVVPGGGSTGIGHQSIVQEAVNNLKAEIRQVKGALLNRRNFASLTPRGSSTSLSTMGTEGT